jgi:hypothetical protein
MWDTEKLAVGLAVAVCFGMAAMPAMATTPEWQLCARVEAKIGKFENYSCSKEEAEGSFEWVEGTGSIRLPPKKHRYF